jgi:hypothetical protein
MTARFAEAMGQLGFFRCGQAVGGTVCEGDPLKQSIDCAMGTLRADIEAVVLTPEEMRKSSAGGSRSMRV